MSTLAATFVELIRRAAVTLLLYCWKCGTDTTHHLVRETELDEYYECLYCFSQRVYRVR